MSCTHPPLLLIFVPQLIELQTMDHSENWNISSLFFSFPFFFFFFRLSGKLQKGGVNVQGHTQFALNGCLCCLDPNPDGLLNGHSLHQTRDDPACQSVASPGFVQNDHIFIGYARVKEKEGDGWPFHSKGKRKKKSRLAYREIAGIGEPCFPKWPSRRHCGDGRRSPALGTASAGSESTLSCLCWSQRILGRCRSLRALRRSARCT